MRSIYNGLKQIVETIFNQSGTSFQQACLVEYPRRGLWAVAFVATDTRGEIPGKIGEPDLVSVFLPTTPNPTSGFLLFVPRRDVRLLDMSLEEAAKLIISAGLVTPPRRRRPRPPARWPSSRRERRQPPADGDPWPTGRETARLAPREGAASDQRHI